MSPFKPCLNLTSVAFTLLVASASAEFNAGSLEGIKANLRSRQLSKEVDTVYFELCDDVEASFVMELQIYDYESQQVLASGTQTVSGADGNSYSVSMNNGVSIEGSNTDIRFSFPGTPPSSACLHHFKVKNGGSTKFTMDSWFAKDDGSSCGLDKEDGKCDNGKHHVYDHILAGSKECLSGSMTVEDPKNNRCTGHRAYTCIQPACS